MGELWMIKGCPPRVLCLQRQPLAIGRRNPRVAVGRRNLRRKLRGLRGGDGGGVGGRGGTAAVPGSPGAFVPVGKLNQSLDILNILDISWIFITISYIALISVGKCKMYIAAIALNSIEYQLEVFLQLYYNIL